MTSDEFVEVATQEIMSELDAMNQRLNNCKSNSDFISCFKELQKSTHKIKGLAPMMGKNDIGTIASLCDSILKKPQDADNLSHDLFLESTTAMSSLMDGKTVDIDNLISNLEKANSSTRF